jgi:hypothetical protein
METGLCGQIRKPKAGVEFHCRPHFPAQNSAAGTFGQITCVIDLLEGFGLEAGFEGGSESVAPCRQGDGPSSPSPADRLDIHPAHPAFGVAGAGRGADRDGGGDAFDLGRGQPDIERAEILLEPEYLLGAGDRDDIGPLSQQPRQR